MIDLLEENNFEAENPYLQETEKMIKMHVKN